MNILGSFQDKFFTLSGTTRFSGIYVQFNIRGKQIVYSLCQTKSMCPMISCLYDFMSIWFHVYMISCLHDLMSIWFHVYMISCLYDFMSTWFHVYMIYKIIHGLIISKGKLACFNLHIFAFQAVLQRTGSTSEAKTAWTQTLQFFTCLLFEQNFSFSTCFAWFD